METITNIIHFAGIPVLIIVILTSIRVAVDIYKTAHEHNNETPRQ